MKPFKLIPSVSFSEKDFRKLLPSKEVWDDMVKKAYQDGSDTCLGCGYSTGNKESLQAHLHDWDGKDYNTAKLVLICEGCHAIKHFDKAIEMGWVVLVNSVYSQEELIKRNRSSGTIKKDMSEHKIMLLKKTPKEYFDEILKSELNRNDKTKILFGSKFSWLK